MALDDLVQNKFDYNEDKFDPMIPTGTEQIYSWISENMKRSSSTNINRASNATYCVRRNWYQANGYESETLTPRKQINFLLGHLSEHAMKTFVEKACVGPGRLYSEINFGKAITTVPIGDSEITIHKQETLTTEIAFGLTGKITVLGHADGFGRRNADGKLELIEFKSAADFGFKKFKLSGPDDYLKQSHMLMMSNECKEWGVDSVRFFYLKKQTGQMWDRLHLYDEAIASQVRFEYKQANSTEIPEKPYSLYPRKDGKLTAGFPCSYCAYLKECQGGYEVEFKIKDETYSPVYVFNRHNK